MAEERLTLEMSGMDVLMAMSEGNPGAATVLTLLVQHTETVDPDSALGSMGAILHLDSLNVYGPQLWVLFKYVCGQDIGKMLAVLRAHQLGRLAGVTTESINESIKATRPVFDLDEVVRAVKDRLPNFQPDAMAA